jgi:hypothetical protein
MGDGHDDLARVPGHHARDGAGHPRLHLRERLAARKAEAARVLLHRLPFGLGRGVLEGEARPPADVHLEQAALDAHRHVPRLGDDPGRLARALER